MYLPLTPRDSLQNGCEVRGYKRREHPSYIEGSEGRWVPYPSPGQRFPRATPFGCETNNSRPSVGDLRAVCSAHWSPCAGDRAQGPWVA